MSASFGGQPGFARWVIWAGDTAPATLTCFDVDGARVNLTGKTIRLRLRHIVSGTPTLIELVSGIAPEVVIADQSNPDTVGTVTITLSAARTAAFPRNASAFTWEVAVLTGAVVETTVAGNVQIIGGAA